MIRMIIACVIEDQKCFSVLHLYSIHKNRILLGKLTGEESCDIIIELSTQ